LTTHGIDNTKKAVDSPKPQSGIYLWVEKVQRMQLFQYGKRLMIEFMVPEPGLSLIQAGQPVRPDVPKPLPLAIGPNDIDETNYLCLAERYQARGVKPPPPTMIQVGDSFATEINEELDNAAEATMQKALPIPPGYAVMSGRFATTGAGRGNRRGEDDNDLDDSDNIDTYPDRYHAHLSVGGEVVLDSVTGVGVEPIANPPRPSEYRFLRTNYQHAFTLISPTVSDDHGIPVAMRFSDHFDNTATMNVYLRCLRTTGLMDAWRLETYQRIVEAHDELEAKYRDALTRAQFSVDTAVQAFGARPAELNRAVERDELKKWSIELMRAQTYTFDAVVSGESEPQQIDPVAADAEAPVVRFFEQSFEWDQMSYLLNPYFWGRSESWALRQKISVPNDPQHEAFLRSGSARVIVPVTPECEQLVLQYLSTRATLPEWSQANLHDWDPDDPNQRIPPTPLDLASMHPSDVDNRVFPDLWLELIEEYKPDVLRGSGKLKVTSGSTRVKLVESLDRVAKRDIGREIYIEGERYEIVSFIASNNGSSGVEFDLDRKYQGTSADPVVYGTGSVKRGAPWDVRVPTTLVVLADNRPKLASLS
jgi:hypothetical protein